MHVLPTSVGVISETVCKCSLEQQQWSQLSSACVSVFFCVKAARTAIGDLPPYFMARAARLQAADPDDEEHPRFEEEELLDQTAQVILCTPPLANSALHEYFLLYINNDLKIDTGALTFPFAN